MSKNIPPAGFVYLDEVIPSLVIDLAYASTNNFVGEVIAGYPSKRALLTAEAAEALGQVQTELKTRNLGLKVFDAYRPQRAVDHFMCWARTEEDADKEMLTKAEFYPNLAKESLFEQGYLFKRSSHSRGSTVDLTLIDLGTSAELDMGSIFDFFDPISWSESTAVSLEAQQNRTMLRSAMSDHGFLPIKTEWWHFTLGTEPYPDSYFDFVIEDS